MNQSEGQVEADKDETIKVLDVETSKGGGLLASVETCMRRGSSTLPVGKLPPEILAKLLGRLTPRDARVVIGPGLELDCSVVRGGQQLLVFKSDPFG